MKHALGLRLILAAMVVLLTGLLFYVTVALPHRERLYTALIQATYTGHEPEAIALLKRGADANLRLDAQTRKPLASGLTAIGARLRGKTVGDRESSVPLLSLAAAYSRKNLLEELLAHGANVEATDGMGSTPLMYAADHNERDILIDLLNTHADVNHQNRPGNTALHLAVNQKNIVNCALLLEHGANPNLTNADGQTPLDTLATLAADVHREWLVAYINVLAAPKSAPSTALPTSPGLPLLPPRSTPAMVMQQFQKQLKPLNTLVSLLQKHGATASSETQRLLSDSFALDPHEANEGLAPSRH